MIIQTGACAQGKSGDLASDLPSLCTHVGFPGDFPHSNDVTGYTWFHLHSLYSILDANWLHCIKATPTTQIPVFCMQPCSHLISSPKSELIISQLTSM